MRSKPNSDFQASNVSLVGSDFTASFSSKYLAVLQVLREAGFKAWLAGGSVRDALLGKEPHDYDLVTDAAVEDLKKLFPKNILVGAQFGVLRVIFQGQEYEIAQFRKESDYRDGRHPSLVESATPEEDAGRRDFTVNALFYAPDENKIYDFVGGLKDLEEKKLRAVGDAKVRFREDHLRILRAVRFRAQLQFELDPSLEDAVISEKSLLSTVSRERVRDEILKMTKSVGWPEAPAFLQKTGLLDVLFPGSPWESSRHLLLEKKEDEAVWWEWGLWCFRSGTKISDVLAQMKSLKLSKSEMKSLTHFLFWFDLDSQWDQESLGSLIEKSFEKGSREGLVLWLSLFPGQFSREAELKKLLQKWTSPPAAWVSAKDLPELKGPELGARLRQAYHRQLGGLDQSKEALLKSLKP